MSNLHILNSKGSHYVRKKDRKEKNGQDRQERREARDGREGSGVGKKEGEERGGHANR